MNTKLYE